jgi:hypothetical protein
MRYLQYVVPNQKGKKKRKKKKKKGKKKREYLVCEKRFIVP